MERERVPAAVSGDPAIGWMIALTMQISRPLPADNAIPVQEVVMFCKRFMLTAVAALMLSGIASGQVLIGPDVQNGSFELLGAVPGAFSAAKASNWDTDPDGDVTYWTNWDATFGGPSTANTNSGTENDPLPTHATNGTKIAYLQGNNAAFNLTEYVVQVGDLFEYTWDYVLAGRGNIIAQLAYEATPGGAIVPIAATTSTNGGAGNPLQLGIGNSYTAMAGDPAVGRLIAVTIQNVPSTNFPELDNVILAVNFLDGDVDGDYNNDGYVDAADYTVWRDNLNDPTEADIHDNGDGGGITATDYTFWKQNFGEGTPPGGGSGGLVGGSAPVPEPATWALVSTACVAGIGTRRKR